MKVIVVHRHGDRAPLTIDTKFWKERDCIESLLNDSNLGEPKIKKCQPGDLTIKGYKQMESLGTYIKKEYSHLDLSNYKARCTEVPRTQTSLQGLLKGLFDKEKFTGIECYSAAKDSLVVPKDCIYLNNVLQRTISDYFTDITLRDTKYVRRADVPPQRIADQYLTALCNNVPIECDVLNCNDEIISKYIETAFEAWKDQANKVKRIDAALEIVFGRFADDMKTYLNDDKILRILSVHDSSLTVILAGIGTDTEQHPPYASAIFIEIWTDPENKKNKFVRILFNNEACKTTLDSNLNIPFDKFMAYLNLIIENSIDSIKKCNETEKDEIHNTLEKK